MSKEVGAGGRLDIFLDSGDACAYLGQGGKASSEGKSMQIYVPPQN